MLRPAFARQLALLASLVLATVLAPAASADVATHTFNYTGATESWTVPAGVTSLTIRTSGGGGGNGCWGSTGGGGARVDGKLAVVPGQVLELLVGGGGQGDCAGNRGGGWGGGSWNGGTGGTSSYYFGYSGAGGGGASAVLIGSAPLVIAGGGGGGSLYFGNGGGGGSSTPGTNSCCGGATGGQPGNATTAGAAGNSSWGGSPATAGSLGAGGNGGDTSQYGPGGGGGGGYRGGGGGGADYNYGAGGGGGSNFIAPALLSPTTKNGARGGNGQIVIYEGDPPAAKQALINSGSVSGGAASPEARSAEEAGLEVTLVSDGEWAAMSAAEFARYDVLVAGDPGCGAVAPGIVSAADVYGPVVLGKAGGRSVAGNRIVVGTDPNAHGGTDINNRGLVTKTGIAFAAQQRGATGMFFSATCGGPYGQSSQIREVVMQLTGGDDAGTWSVNPGPPCGGSVSLIADHPSFDELTTTSLAGWGCSVHETFPTFPTEWSALAVATDTDNKPTCGIDPDNGESHCGEAYVLIAGSGIVVVSGSISVDPADATADEGGTHTVDATVTSGDDPLAGQAVTFNVTGRNAGVSGTCVPADCKTDSQGEVSFTYEDGGTGAGDDTIKASFTDAAGSLQAATAQMHWTERTQTTPPSATLDPDNDVTVDEGTTHVYRYTTNEETTSVATSCGDNGTKGAETSASFECSFADGPATSEVSVTPSDADGNAGETAKQTVTVSNVAPTVALDSGNPSSVNESQSARTFAYSISDPGDDDVTAVVTSCGSAGEKVAGSDANTNSAGSFQCVFVNGPASSTVSVNATDSDGDTGNTDTQSVEVNDPAVTASADDLAGVETKPLTDVVVGGFTDPTGYSTAGEYTASIDWGDGSPQSAGTITKTGDGEFVIRGSHTYAWRGTYTTTVTVTDADNAENSDAASGTAVIADAPIHAQGMGSVNSPEAFSGPVATFTDEGNGPASEFTATIEWGDGSSSAGTVSGPDGSGTFTVNGSHVYAGTGPYTVTVNVVSAGGSTDSATTEVLVYAFTAGNGSFAISDKQSAIGTKVTFWGAQWEKLNPFSNGTSGSSAFKGYVGTAASAPKCGDTWTAAPGNSGNPPASVPAYMAVVVASTESKSGSSIRGDVKKVVVVKTAAGYAPNPGNAGTGTVVAKLCG